MGIVHDRKMKTILKNSDNSSSQFPAGMRVLVVDGNQGSLQQLETMLERCDYEVAKCNQGKDALKLLEQSNRFDIILTERDLPDIDVFDLLGALGEISDLPLVIVMSEFRDNSTIMDIIKSGACYYLVKPIQIEELTMIWVHAFKQSLSKCHEVPQWTNEKKKKRMNWKPKMKRKFQEYYQELEQTGEATPTKILERMVTNKDAEGLTRAHVASYHQKYKGKMRRINNAPVNKTTSNQLYLPTQKQRAPAAGSISLEPNIGTQGFQNVQSNVRSSFIAGSTTYGGHEITQTLSSEKPCNEQPGGQPVLQHMPNAVATNIIIQEQAVSASGVTYFPTSELSNHDISGVHNFMSSNTSLPSSSQDFQNAQSNFGSSFIAGSTTYGGHEMTQTLSSEQPCNEQPGGQPVLQHMPNAVATNIIQEQAVNANGVTHFPTSELSNHDISGVNNFMSNNTSLPSSTQDCGIIFEDFLVSSDYSSLCNEGLPSTEEGTAQHSNNSSSTIDQNHEMTQTLLSEQPCNEMSRGQAVLQPMPNDVPTNSLDNIIQDQPVDANHDFPMLESLNRDFLSFIAHNNSLLSPINLFEFCDDINYENCRFLCDD